MPGAPRNGSRARRADAEFTSVGVELDRPSPHADRAAREQVARCLEHDVPGVTDRQEGELGASGQVPEHHPCPYPRPAAGCRAGSRDVITRAELARHGRMLGTRGRDRPGTWSIGPRANDDSSVRAEFRSASGFAGQAQHRAGPGPRPRAAAGSQPLLASELAGGVEGRMMPPLVEPSRVAFRMPVGASQRSILNHRTPSPEWCRRGSRRPPTRRRSGIVRTTRPVSTSRIRHVAVLRILVDDRDLGAVRAKRQVAHRPAGARAGWDGRSPGRR